MNYKYHALVFLVILLVEFGLGASTATPSQTAMTPTLPSNQMRTVAYFTQWGIHQRHYLVKNVDINGSAAKLTHINYAFGNIKAGDLVCYIETKTGLGDGLADFQKVFTANESVDGVGDSPKSTLNGNFNQLKKLKTKYPNLKVLISLGGWAWSANFFDAALPENRVKFVQSCIDLYIKGNLPVYGVYPQGGPGSAAGIFDGIDIDWEYPASPGSTNNYRATDTQNYTALLAEFRKQLDDVGVQTGKHYLLTVAAPANQKESSKIELNKIYPYLDYLNLMTYNFYQPQSIPNGPTNFPSQLYNSPHNPAAAHSVDSTVMSYLAAGIPANKLVVGVQFFGRGWTNVPNNNNGLYQSALAMTAAPGTFEKGVEDYRILKNLTYPSFRDPITKAFWIYDGSTWWSYDDPTSIQAKMDYIKSKGLGGAMAWSLDGDDGTLLSAVYTGLH